MTKASFILAETKQKPTVQLAICYDSSAIWAPTHLEVRKETWMTDMIIAWMSRWNLGSMVRINGVYWGYNPLTNLLLTSWDIQVEVSSQHQF